MDCDRPKILEMFHNVGLVIEEGRVPYPTNLHLQKPKGGSPLSVAVPLEATRESSFAYQPISLLTPKAQANKISKTWVS